MSAVTNKEGRVTHRYRLFGLGIASDIELPELREDPDPAAEVDVIVRAEALPEPRQSLASLGEHVDIAPVEFRLQVPDVAGFLVRDGREIFVDARSEASPHDVRAYLLGSVVGVLVYQAGLLPLHASALAHRDRAAAFLGHSGAGKSTLAHRLSGRGYGLLSDDVCVIHGSGDSPPMAWPGIRQFKLWDSSLVAAGESKTDLRPVLMREDKFLLPSTRLAEDRPYRLDVIYLLGRDANATENRIVPLKGLDAINALVSNTYRGVALRRMGRSAWHLQRCAELARHCRIFSLTMAWGFDRADHVYAQIADHMRVQLESGT